MPNYVVYFVAINEPYVGLSRMAVESLYLSGYKGKTVVVTSQPFVSGEATQPSDVYIPWTSEYAPAGQVTFRKSWDCIGHPFGTKMQKAKTGCELAGEGYDAILFLDCDVLIVGDITPRLDTIAANPSKVYVAHTNNRRLLGVKGIVDALTEEQKATIAEDQQMVDSYAVGFAPSHANIDLMQTWDTTNAQATMRTHSDAIGLNVATVAAGRLADIEWMTECERLNGLPSDGTIVQHYVYGQTVRMPLVYQNEIERPYLDALAQVPPPVPTEPEAEQGAQGVAA